MLARQQLLAEYKNKHSKIMKGFHTEYALLNPRACASMRQASEGRESDASASGVPMSSSRFEETRIIEGSAERSGASSSSIKASSEVTSHKRDTSVLNSGARKDCAGQEVASKTSLIGGQMAPAVSPSSEARVLEDVTEHAWVGVLRNDNLPLRGQTGSDAVAQSSAVKDTQRFPNTVGYTKQTHATEAPAFPRANIAEPCTMRTEEQILDDETMLAEETRIQDYSCFMGDQAHTIDALNRYHKRRARRRTGRRVQKRPHTPCPEFPDDAKRRKTEETKSFLVEYYQALQNTRTQSRSGALDDAERGRRARWKKRVRRARKEALDLKNEMEKELEAVRKVKEELLYMEERKKAEEEALWAKMATEAEEIRRLREEREEDMKKLAEYQRLLGAGANNRSERVPRPAKHSSERNVAPEADDAALESKIFVERQMVSKPSDINSFFAAARKKHIEKANQTLHSRTMINDASEVVKQKVTFNNVPHKPRQPVLKMAEISPQDLYKQTIDAQNGGEDPRDYVPGTEVPVYASEDEFETKEKRFEPAPFAKDPSLQHTVRKQSHNEIRRFFGAQLDIDVEDIFRHVENVTNFSPNKLIRRAKKA